MSTHRYNKRSDNWIKFLLYPVVFFIVTSAISLAIIIPVSAPYRDMLSLFLLREEPNFDRSKGGIYADAVSNSTATAALPADGSEFGTISIPSVGIDAPAYYGDTPTELRKGVGLYTGGYLPGQGRTILGGAHNDSFFQTLPDVQVGDEITFTTPYGTYYYTITGQQVARFDDEAAVDLLKDEDNIILYTCKRWTQVGATPFRVFVYGTLNAEKSADPIGLIPPTSVSAGEQTEGGADDGVQ
ncbi:MAG: sortase [Clostridiales Family XIII bacterium]|jgi:LPXTG-site transpeptidase (sortase) family protein|nr:sortase [Clostridiales Family XIII bacterium]